MTAQKKFDPSEWEPVQQQFDPSEWEPVPQDTTEHSNAGWDWEAGKAGYFGGMGNIAAAVGEATGLKGVQSYGEEVRDRNAARADLASRQSTDPGSWKEMQFGDSEKGFLPYARKLALGSAPYMAEAAGYAVADTLTGGALTPAIVARYATKAAPLLKGAITRGVAEGLTKEAATAGVAKGLARTAMLPAVTYPSSLGDILSNQYEQNKSYDLLSAAALAVPYAALNVLGVEGAMTRGFDRVTLNALAKKGLLPRAGRAAVQMGVTGGEEGVGELGQEITNQAGRVAVDSNTSMMSPEALERYKESFIGGAVLGGLPGGIHGGLSRGEHAKTELLPNTESQNQEQEALPPAPPAPPAPAPEARTPPPTENGVSQPAPEVQAAAQEQQALIAKQLQDEKDVRAKTLEHYNAEPVTTDSGLVIGTKFGGKVYNHTAEGGTESNPKLVAAVNKTIATDLANSTQAPALHAMEVKVLEAAKETGLIARGEASPKSVKKLVEDLNLTADTPPETAVHFIEAQVKTLEGKTTDAANIKREFYNVLISKFGGTPLEKTTEAVAPEAQPKETTTEGVNHALQEPGAGEVFPGEPQGAGKERGQRGGMEQGQQGVEAAQAGIPGEAGGAEAGRAGKVKSEVPSLKDVSSANRDIVKDIMGWDDSGATVNRPMSLREAARAFEAREDKPISQTTIKNRLVKEGFSADLIKAQTEEGAGARAAPISEEHEAALLPTAENNTGMGVVDSAGAAQINIGTGKGWKGLLAAKVPFSDTRWTNDMLAEAAAKKPGLLGEKIAAEMTAREKLRVAKIEATKQGAETETESPHGMDEERNIWNEAHDENGNHYSEAAEKTGNTKDVVDGVLRKTMFSKTLLDKIVSVYHTQEEAVAANPNIKATSERGVKIGGFTTKDGKVGLIAEYIPKGSELAIFVHEVGVHLGMEKLIGKANMEWLQERVGKWASQNDGSLESRVAKEAIKRASKSSSADKGQEIIAYTVEGLIRGFPEEGIKGINPQAFGITEGHKWFRKLYAALKASLRKLGFKDFDKFTSQHLVDLAYGAAHMEIEGAWHGTAADFRKFNHAYMGSGEGAQAYGWGTYLAQREGIGRDYMKQDVKRKSGFRDPKAIAKAVGSAKEAVAKWEGHLATGEKLLKAATTEAAIAQRTGMVNEARRYVVSSKESLREAEQAMKQIPEGSLMRVASSVREDEFLDWDKPLSEQSEKVKDALKKLPETVVDRVNEDLFLNPYDSGEDLYLRLVREKGSKEAASKYLDSIGIKGIRFLDAASRKDVPAIERRIKDASDDVARWKKEIAQTEESAPNSPNSIGWRKTATSNLKVAERILTQAKDALAKPQTSNLVIFNDKNIVRAVTHPGGEKEETRYSEAAPRATVSPDSPSKGVWEKAGAAFDRFFNDPLTMVKEHGLGWLSMDHLVEVAQGVNDKLVEYRDVSRKMQAMSKEWVYKAAKIDAEWGKLSDAEAKNLSAVMRAATRAGFDPETSAVPATVEESKIKDVYAKLTPAAVKVYKAARDHYATARVERQKIASGVLAAAHESLIKSAKESKDPKKIAASEAKLKSQLEKLDEKYRKVKGPYFPLMRLGKWYVVGMSKELAALEAIDEPSKSDQAKIAAMRKSENHYTTSSYETKSQAKAAQKILAKKYAETRFNRAEEKSHAAGVLSAAGLQDVEQYINSSFDKEVADEIRTMMAELYYEALPEHHALKHEMKREGVHGEEEDMRRVFAVSTIKSAHYMSRLKHADDLKSALFTIRREGKKSSDAMEYYNEVVKRAKLSMDETSAPWADKVAAVSYLAHLGLNPAFVLTNASQVAMITAPWLAARTSTVKATTALGSAYRVAGELIRSSYSEQGWRAELNWEGKVQKGVADMLTTLLKRNLLDITIEHDLGATAELKNRVLGDALKIGNLPVHITELGNRAVTAIAAYNLAVSELKMSQAEAEEFAAKAVSMTQLDYSALNAPRHMQRVLGSAPAARIVMQFRKYQQGMLWLIGRSIYNALKGASPKEKAEARKTLLGLFTTTGVMAGSLGMPLAGTAMWGATMLASLFGDDDEPWDARVAYQNWLAEVVGKDAATAIAKGVPAWLFGIDLEKRLGMGDIASPLPFMRQGKTAREDAANALLAVAGAPVGMMVDMWEGVGMMAQGDWWKGAEKVVPLKGIQNLSRGARYGMEGMTEKDGDLILPPEAFSATDIGAKMAGFATTKESTYYEATSAVKGAQLAAQDVRKKLLGDYAQAKIAGEDTTDIVDKINSFNTRHPEKGLRIDVSSRIKSVQAKRLALRQRGETGLIKNKQTKPFLKEAAFAE